MNLRRRAGIRHLLLHPWQLGLSLLGVALGVAVVVATGLAVESSREALRVSVETVSGRATHRVVGGPGGVPDSLAARLVTEAGVRTLAPAVEGYVVSPVDPSRPLRILGIDPFSEAPFRPWLAGGPAADGVDGARLVTTPGGAILGAETASALGVEEGGRLAVQGGARTAVIEVVGILEAEDRWSRSGLLDLLVLDVAEAQEILGRDGVVDRLDLILPDGDEGAALLARIEALLPPGTRVEAAGAEAGAMQDMLRAFDLNLRALSLLALVFGIFLIYNAMTFSVVQRRGMLGTLRALGTTRGELVRGILAEGAVVGFVGSVVGLLAGIVLGRGLVQLVTRTINDLYFVVAVEGVTLSPGFIVRSLLLGTGATLLAALLPAWEAGAASPRDAMARSSVEDRVRTLVPRAAVAGVIVLGVGAVLLALPTPGIEVAFGGLFALILGMALLIPATTVVLVGLLRPAARRIAGVIGAMAARGVVTSLSRTAPALAALVVAVSVTVALGVMIQSFRGSVVGWLDTTLVADVHVTGPSVVAARPDGVIPPGLAGAARGLPGVVGVSSYRSVALQSGGVLTRLLAVELDPRGEAGFEFLAGGEARDAVFAAFRAGEGFLVTEPFAFHRGLQVGDTLSLDGALDGELGPLERPVLAVFRDYGSEAGTVLLSRNLYDAHWTDERLTSLAIFLDGSGASEEEAARIASRLREAAGPETPLVIRSNTELRERSLEVFDRAFEVTRVLRWLAFVVAFIAVLSALMALQLERRRELGVLRAQGMTPAQVWGLVSMQTGIMGGIAGLLALPVGAVLALVMILVVNRRSFGWTLEVDASPELFLQGVLLALAGAILAGIYPSWRMARTSPAEALRGE